jgi:hypothetical protein
MAETAEEARKRIEAAHRARQDQHPTLSLVNSDDQFDPTETRQKGIEIIKHLYPDEPFFVFRAKDILSSFALDTYAELVEKFDPQGNQLVDVTDILIEFRHWQRTNPDKVKLPG